MTEFLCKKKWWAKLRKLAGQCNGPRWISTPYLGRSARSLISLRKNDVLICAMTEQNVRAGSVCPTEVQWMQQRGVKVYTQSDLHAKVYLFGDTSVVCSANLSLNSHESLDETGLLTDNRQVINELRAWFRNRFGSLVTPAWLPQMIPLFPSEPQATTANEERLWLEVMVDTNFPTHENKYRLPCESTAQQRLGDSSRYEVLTTKWQYRPEIQFGDRLIQVWKENDKWTVWPHARVLEVVHFQTPKGQPRAYVCLEMPQSDWCIPYGEFRSKCSAFGLKLDDDPNSQDMIQITSIPQKRELLRITTYEP